MIGCDYFYTEYYNDPVYIYDGYESEKKVFNFLTGVRSSRDFNQISNGQIMEIVFKRLNNSF